MLSIGFAHFCWHCRYNGGSCLHVQAHYRIFPSGLYNRSWFPPCIGGLSAYMGNVVHSTYTTGARALPDVYAQSWGPQARGRVRMYQAKHSSLWYKYNIAQAKGSALSGIENVWLGAIHGSETIRNSPNSLEKQQSHSYWHCFCAVSYIPPLLGLISWVYWITCQYRTLFRFNLPMQSSLYAYIWWSKSSISSCTCKLRLEGDFLSKSIT